VIVLDIGKIIPDKIQIKSDRIGCFNRFEVENYREYPIQILGHESEPHKALLAEFFPVILQINEPPLICHRVFYLCVQGKSGETVAKYFLIE
jgi:hypothetical protein